MSIPGLVPPFDYPLAAVLPLQGLEFHLVANANAKARGWGEGGRARSKGQSGVGEKGRVLRGRVKVGVEGRVGVGGKGWGRG